MTKKDSIPRGETKKTFSVLHLETLLKALQEKKVRAKDFFIKHRDFFAFKQMTKDQILGIAEKAGLFLQGAIDSARQSNVTAIKYKDSTGIYIDFESLCADVHKALDEFLSTPIASIIDAEGTRLRDEVQGEMKLLRGRMGSSQPQLHAPATNLQELQANLQHATESLRGFGQEMSGLLNVGQKLQRLRELERLRIIENLRSDDNKILKNEERFLRSLEVKSSDCAKPECPCPKTETCIVKKILLIYHYITFRDFVAMLFVSRVWGKELTDDDGSLGASFTEIQEEVGEDPRYLENTLKKLIERGLVRQLANGRYTQRGTEFS